MGRALSGALAAGLGAFALVELLRGSGGCLGDGPSGAGPGDAQAEVEADASDAADTAGDPPDWIPPWDPVWHETGPTTLEVVPRGPERDVDCGPSCRVIAAGWPDGSSGRQPRASGDWCVFQVAAAGGVRAVNLTTEAEYVVDDGTAWPAGRGAGGGPSVSGSLALYAVRTDWGNVIVVRSLATGEMKAAWSRAHEPDAFGAGTVTTSFAHPYAYWWHGPPEFLYRFDLRDGSLRSFPGGGWHIVEGASTGIAVAAGEGFTEVIDFEAQTSSKLGSSPYQDLLGTITSDGITAVWIDQRDPGPAGQHGTFEEPYGGELYEKDLATGKDARLTFDSPDAPRFKTMAKRADGRTVWGGSLDEPYGNPLYAQANWYLDAEGKPAPLGEARVDFPQPTTRGVVGKWTNATDAGAVSYLVLIEWPDAPALRRR